MIMTRKEPIIQKEMLLSLKSVSTLKMDNKNEIDGMQKVINYIENLKGFQKSWLEKIY